MKRFIQKAIPKLYGFYFNLLQLFSSQKAAALALRVFSIPRSGFLKEDQQAYLDKARKQQIGYEDGLIMLYHWKGDGPTVLLNHGWESNSWRWKYLIEPLKAEGYNIVSIDAPAHGNSSGKLFTAVKYSKVIRTVMELYEPSIVIAHSVGAMATIYQESQHPHPFLRRLVLLGSPNKLEVIMKGYQNIVGFNKSVYSSLNQHLNQQFGFQIKEFNTADFAKKVNVPTLLIHHTEDAIVGYEAMQEIASQMPNATTYTSSTGGHSLHTQEVIDQVMEFLRKSDLPNN
ncbi:alpha/beta fold hydrolase [Nonlabens xiamenensis]|uniref:alpha/beta fold hydrolase n=1 Tax=Nonlabens xiamenensis TaxID=2341043 RepID=UPI0013DE4BFB|nr:alpha/beta hydrolase [Nonlabens xiamenensis]